MTPQMSKDYGFLPEHPEPRLEITEGGAEKTLRDEFAMAGLHLFSQNLLLAADRGRAIKNAAVSAYALANAMMKERSK